MLGDVDDIRPLSVLIIDDHPEGVRPNLLGLPTIVRRMQQSPGACTALGNKYLPLSERDNRWSQRVCSNRLPRAVGDNSSLGPVIYKVATHRAVL